MILNESWTMNLIKRKEITMCDAMEDYKNLLENQLAELREQQDSIILQANYYFQTLADIHKKRYEITNKLYHLKCEEEKNDRNS